MACRQPVLNRLVGQERLSSHGRSQARHHLEDKRQPALHHQQGRPERFLPILAARRRRCRGMLLGILDSQRQGVCHQGILDLGMLDLGLAGHQHEQGGKVSDHW